MEIIKIAIQTITPIAVVVLGVILLRKVEGIKSEVAKSSEFTCKWAEEFWITCHEYMKCTERYMAILNYLQFLSDPNNDMGTKYQKECNELNVKLSELELRIKRMVVFAPTNGTTVKNHASNILSSLTELVKTLKGSFDPLVQEINNFNNAARNAHVEIMGIKDSRKLKETKVKSESGETL